MGNQEYIFKTIKGILSKRPHTQIRDGKSGYIHAAVLIPFFMKDNECKILFTKRTNRVENHKGQISFPGGAVDEQDKSLEETALREAWEEVGLLRDDVTVLGRVDDALTLVSSFIIHPFVGFFPYPYNFNISPEEVKRLIYIPFRLFFQDNFLDNEYPVEYEGITYRTPAYDYKGDVIWGATARIMVNFMEIVGEKLNLPEGEK